MLATGYTRAGTATMGSQAAGVRTVVYLALLGVVLGGFAGVFEMLLMVAVHGRNVTGADVFGVALFYAMLSGSWLGGALAMSGFGLGTLPVLLGAGLGLPMLRRRATAGWLRNTVALAIIAVGIVSAGMSPSTLAAWCRT